jgi:hypothetical protein
MLEVDYDTRLKSYGTRLKWADKTGIGAQPYDIVRLAVLKKGKKQGGRGGQMMVRAVGGRLGLEGRTGERDQRKGLRARR